MKKEVLFGSFMVGFLLLSGCSYLYPKSGFYKEAKESEDYILPIRIGDNIEEEIQGNIFNFKQKDGPKYQVEELIIDGLGNPGGILCRENEILITDSKNDNLIVVDYDGNIVRKVGKTGNGPLEFLSPGDMAVYDNKIYIIDQKNYRVQILDAQLNYLDEIETRIVEQNEPDFVFQHIAVSKAGIYLNGKSFFHDYVYLYQMNKENPVIIGKNFYGPLFFYEGGIYATNTATKVYEKKEDTMSYRSGLDNYFLLIDMEKQDFSKRVDLIPALDATDIFINQEEMTFISPTNASIFVFDKAGDYQYTLATMEKIGGDSLPRLSKDDWGRYYVTAFDQGSVFRCVPEKK